MFKFVLFAALIAVAAAEESAVKKRSVILADAAIIHEPTLAKVGDIVHSIPTAVSHQSSTVVHDRANVVTPIVAPAVKTRLAPVLTDYTVPIARSYPTYSYPYVSYYY